MKNKAITSRDEEFAQWYTDVVKAAKKALYTGSIGDGKIFVYDVENVIKVRTGEEGFDALQGDDDLTA